MWHRVGVPKSERFFDFLYFSIQVVDFFFDFFSESLHFVSCHSVPGAKPPRIFVFLGGFAPFFLVVRVFRFRACGPKSEHLLNLKK